MGRAMVVWLLVQLSAVLGSVAQQSVQNPTSLTYLDYEDQLQEAAYEVLQQEDWQSYEFPEFKMPSDFMHSFIPGTGVGNREDLVIDVIRNIPVYYDMSFSKWRYERFNNSDYVMGIHKNNVALWRTSVTDKKPFQFASTDLMLIYSPEGESIVLDSILFSRSVDHLQVLYVAVLTGSSKSDLINIYEIIDSKGILVTVIDLGFKTPSESSGSRNKLAYVRSQHGGSLVVLVDREGENKITYQRRGSNILSHYIEVHCQSPVDLVTFSINGHGYIAVANRTIAEVFKMDDFLQDHKPFEWFPYTENILDLEYFRLGFHHYLAIAAERYQALFVWKSGGFFTKQEFYLPDAQQWYSALLPTCRDDIILFLIQKQSAEVFVWDGRTENFAQVPHVTPVGFNPLAGSITSFSYNTTAFLIFAKDEDNTQMFSIETHLKSVSDPLLIAGEEISDVMKHLEDMLEEQEQQIGRISAILVNAVRYHSNQAFTAHQTFNTIQTSDELSSELLTIYKDVNWNNSPLTLEEFNRGTEELEDKVKYLEHKLNSLEKLVQDVVLFDENATITGSKAIEHVYGNNLKVDGLHVESVAGINIKRLQNEIYRLDRPQLINGFVNFTELTVEGDMDVKLTLNGMDFGEELMTTDSDQVSRAVMTFEEKLNVLGNLDLSGTVNGIDISKDVVTLHGNHVISGIKSFPDGILAENVETKLLDGLDIVDLERRAFTQTGDQVIPGGMTFDGAIYGPEFHLFGLINGHNISELAERLVRIDVPAKISGSKFFRDVNIRGDLTVKGLLDNTKFPEDLLMPDKMQVVTGKKSFINEVELNEVNVIGTVDGLNLPYDIISLTGNEAVDTTLYFASGLNVQNDITVKGLLDGVEVSSLKRILNHQDASRLRNVTFLGPLTILQNVDVNGSVNGIPLKEMVKDLVFKDEKEVVFTAPKTYSSVIAGSVNVRNKINSYNLTDDFMFARGDQTIRGVKTFKELVKFHDVITDDGQISGINIEQLYQKRISLSYEDYETTEFNDLVVQGRLVVHGSINGLKFPDDVVLNSAVQTISNKIFDGDLHFESLVVDGDMLVSGTFSGVSLPAFFDQTITLTGYEEIHGDIVLGNTTAFSVRILGSVNELDIVEFAENIMSLSKDQTITAFKEFSGNVNAFQNVSTLGINGINLADVKQRAFKLHDTNVVTAPFTAEDTLTAENLFVEGNINGVNFDELVKDSVRTSDTIQLIAGDTIFREGFHVNGNIQAEVNGLDIFKDVLLKHIPQEITGKYTFGALTVGENVEIDGLVNGIDLSEVNAMLAKRNMHNTIMSDLIFKKPVDIRNDIEVAGLINGKDSNQLKATSLLETGDQFITGQKILQGNVTIYGEVDSVLINGVNWGDFLEDVVRIDIPQNIPAPKTFLADLEVRGDIFASDKASVGLINGVDLEKILNEAVFTDKTANITGDKVFTSPVEISGELIADLINGLNLKQDVVTLQCVDEGAQFITGSKEFQNLTVMGNVIVQLYVNGYKLKDLYLDTLTTHGNQTISGHKYFEDLLTVESNIYPNTVNGLNLKDLVPLNTHQEIEASMTFSDDVHIKGNLEITGTVNGIDLGVLNSILYTDTDQTITGSYILDNAVAKSDMSVEGTINDIDLRNFSRSVNQFYADTVSRRDSLMVISERQCHAAKYLHSIAEAAYYTLDGFTIHQILNYSADFIEANPDTKDLMLIQTIEEGSSVTAFGYRYDSSENQFVSSTEFLTNIVKRKYYQFGNHQLVINVGAQSKESFVSYGNAAIAGLKGFTDGDAAVLKNKVYLALLYASTGYCEMFNIGNFSSYPSVSSTGSIFVGKETKALTVFEAWGEVYVAFSRKFDLPLYKQSSPVYLWQDGWKLAQEIPAPASSDVIHFEHLSHHYLVFTNSLPVHETLDPMHIQVYRHTGEKSHPFKLYQKIPFDNAQTLEVFEFGNLPDLYLTTFNDTRVKVYRLDGEAGFVPNFTLGGKCITTIKTVLIENKLFLVVSQHDRTYVEPSMTVIYKGVTQGSIVPRKEFKHCP